MLLTTNQKGTIGLVKVITDLTVRGYETFTPTSDASPVDVVVADSSFSIKRLQVKYREPCTQSSVPLLVIGAFSVVNGKKIPIDLSKIDGWAVYSPLTDKVYYIPVQYLTTTTLRVYLSDFPGRKSSLLAEDFSNPNSFWKVN